METLSLTLDPRSRTIGRTIATILAIIPAFLLSLFIEIFSVPWIISNTVWIIVYLYYFLYHSTAYLNRYSLVADETFLRVSSGVLYQTTHRIPCENIQFVVQSAGPMGKLFGITTLRIMMAGGIVVVPGLSQKDAKQLIAFLNLPDNSQ